MNAREEQLPQIGTDLLRVAVRIFEEQRAALRALVDAAHERCILYDSAIRTVDQKHEQHVPHQLAFHEKHEYLVSARGEAYDIAHRLNAALAQVDQAIRFLSSTSSQPDQVLHHASSERILQAKEEERARIARDLHDGPAQVVSNTIFQIEACIQQADQHPECVADTLAAICQDLRVGSAEIRGLIAGLRRPAGLDIGLEVAMRHYLQTYSQRFGIQVKHDLSALNTPMPDMVAVALFRIVQEALQNIHKHAEASQVVIESAVEAGILQLRITDNGKGFDPAQVQTRGGYHIGLSSMRERVSLINGTLDITSHPETGTTVLVRVSATW